MIRPRVKDTALRTWESISQPACLMAGVMNLVQMSRSERALLLKSIGEPGPTVILTESELNGQTQPWHSFQTSWRESFRTSIAALFSKK